MHLLLDSSSLCQFDIRLARTMAVTDGAVTGGYLKEFETPELPTYSVCFIGP